MKTASRLLGSLVLLLVGGCSVEGEIAPDGGSDGPGLLTGDPCAPAPTPTGDEALCAVTLRYRPPHQVSAVSVAGEWNKWSPTAQPLSGPDGKGEFTAELKLLPGIYSYKLVLDGKEWRLDDGNQYRKYEAGVENSGLRVPDCHRPSLRLVKESLRITRAASAGQGELRARVEVVPAAGRPPGLCHIKSALRRPETHKSTGVPLPPLPDAALGIAPDRTALDLALSALSDGKYTLTLTAEAGGKDSEPLLLPFWIEPERFSFADSPLYMAVTDRFVDGDAANNRPVAGVSAPANYQGGDLLGVAQKIDEGYFDRLGVRALWLTPFYTQPEGSFIDQSGMHQVAAYHGYWPVRARQVDARLGGDEALHTLVEKAHRHGIRVLMDAVLNHVHDQHEYFQDATKKSWFRTGCICGTTGCDWTEKRLSCLFSSYMPDIDWTVTAASEAFIDDTLYWLEEFDLDGLRIDAVKHVEDLAVWNLGTRVRERFERAGTRQYLLGETAMGWNDGTVANNRDNYDTIKRYMGGDGLDGQFDFVWYHGVAYRVFAYDERRFLHLDYWTHAGLGEWNGALMVNYLGSHDSSRFVTLSTYRDATGFHKWSALPGPPDPGDTAPYDRLWLGMLSLMTLPGVPLLYYGDEYGEYGGGDPDNRHFMRLSPGLLPGEARQLERMTALLEARNGSRGLRRGALMTVLLGEDVYAYARLDPQGDPRQVAVVVLNRLTTLAMPALPILPELGWKSGARLRDLLGGPGYTTSGSLLNVTVPPRSAIILALE
jgi:glycosidase